METVPLEKPCKVSTERGFSILYKNRYLYSKYNPQKAILQTIASLEIREGTLILCFSPGLWYGFTELIAKLPENCLLVACEADPALHNFSKEELSGCQNLSNSRLIFLSPEEALQFPQNLAQDIEKKFPQIKKEFVKRVIRLDFSAGVQFNQEFYTKIFSLCQTVTAQFWKNRLTLVKFGRLYSSNLIQNIARSQTSKSIRFEKLKKSISKPVLVLGTGESLERTVNLLADKNLRKKCYILAADATLPVLTANGIFPDAVAGVESQLAIEKSYIGTASHTEKPFLFFADTTSRFHVADIAPGKVCYFTSEYDNQGVKERVSNYKQAFQEDIELGPVISKIGELMTKYGYSLKDAEMELKNLSARGAEDNVTLSKTSGAQLAESPLDILKRRAKADIIIQLGWVVKGSTITFTLEAFDAYTSKRIATSTATANRTTEAVPLQLQHAVEKHIKPFDKQLDAFYSNIKTNGREIILTIHTWDNWDSDLESDYDGEELLGHIQQWLAKNTVNQQYNLSDATENFAQFEQVMIPLKNEKDVALDARGFARGLQRYLNAAPFNISSKLMMRGLGEAILVLGEK